MVTDTRRPTPAATVMAGGIAERAQRRGGRHGRERRGKRQENTATPALGDRGRDVL
jgi:hypothetical protein